MRKLLGGLWLLLSACVAPGAVEDVEETTQEVVSANGVSLNGVSLNGVSLNGVSLNGVSLNGVSLNGVSLNGVSLNGVSLNGTTMTGARSDNGQTITVSSIGRTMTATLSNGATLVLRIDSAVTLSKPNTDVWSYGISYQSDAGWSPLCGASVGALAVAGTWDTRAGVPGGGAYSASTTSFSFACRSKTIAKCVEMGYKTWKGRTPQLESCVRLLRGDYCGDGTPYTVDGNQVNLYDNLGVQADTMAWVKEAEWTPAGARCITVDQWTRFSNMPVHPSCIGSTSSGGTLPAMLSCGLSFTYGAVLISEIYVAAPPLPGK